MYTIIDVAKWFLNKEPMCADKLQKLCYYTQAWSYVLNNKPLFNGNFKSLSCGAINSELAKKLHKFDVSKIKLRSNAILKKFPIEDLMVLESVWKTYGKSTSNALMALTQVEPPLINARHRCGKYKNIIKVSDMKEYYSSIYIGNNK